MNRIKASIAGAAIIAGTAIGVPVVQAASGVGVAAAEARPDPGQGYNRCYVFYIKQSNHLYVYRRCV